MNHWLWAYLIVGYQIHEPLNATWDVTAMSSSKWQGGTTLPGWVLCTVQMILFTRIIFLSTRNVEMILTHDLGCCCSSANHEFHLSKYACTMNKRSSILERSKKKNNQHHNWMKQKNWSPYKCGSVLMNHQTSSCCHVCYIIISCKYQQ